MTGWLEDVFADRLGQPGARPQLRHVVRVLHEPDVEHEVGLERDAELEAEADELDGELVRAGSVVASWAKSRSRSSRSDRSDVSTMTSASARTGSRIAPLLGDRAGDAALVAERMAVAGLAEPPDQDLVARLEEEDLRPDPAALQRAAHRPERQRRVAGRGRRARSRPGRTARGPTDDELREVGQELAGQVVDDGVAEVLEQLRRGGLAPAGQAGQDHDRLLPRHRR